MKCRIPLLGKKRKLKGEREEKGKDPRELLIPPGARSVEYTLSSR